MPNDLPAGWNFAGRNGRTNFALIFFLIAANLCTQVAFAQPVELKISKQYLNIPIGSGDKMYAIDVLLKGEKKRRSIDE